MDLKAILKKGISMQIQRPGAPENGPITPSLNAMSIQNSGRSLQSGDDVARFGERSISPVGSDLAKLFAQRSIRVLFLNTEGDGVTPWRGLIILDAGYRGEGQTRSPDSIARVAHELTHLLQRELNQPYYWPGGGLRPSPSRRWLGDSTNYMEVLSYLVEWTVEYDLITFQNISTDLSSDESAEKEKILEVIRDRLATLSGSDPRNACRLVLKLFPDNPIYRQNFELENRTSDGRIPPGSWHQWLRQMGFSRQAVDHIMIIASQG
jgi:hypothetical protein